MAALVAAVAERAATGWRLYRDAAAVDPEIAADWHELQSCGTGLLPDPRRHSRQRARRRTHAKEAVDTAWAIASPESYDLLVHRLGYTLPEFQAWMKQTL